ncbi:MAG: outer membrane beta-barrel protein [Bacteroidales bacterium]
MKNIFITTVLTLCISLYNMGQLSAKENNSSVNNFGTYVFAQEDTLEPGKQEDTTYIKFKGKNIRITEDEKGTSIEVKKEEQGWDFEEEEREHHWSDRSDNGPDLDWDFGEDKGFDVHWSGFEIGLNNYLNKNFSMSLSEENSYMDLNTGKSWNVNLNFIEYDLALIGEGFGVGTGMGIEFNDYRFDNRLPIKKNDGSVIVDSTYVNRGYNREKAKLTTTYITVPVIFEYQARVGDHNKLFFSAGVIGGMKLGSHTKVIYKDDGDKNKDKNRNDFFLSPFRYGYTVRAGYGFLKIFANYYETTLFEKDKGPQLHPFTIGFMLSL